MSDKQTIELYSARAADYDAMGMTPMQAASLARFIGDLEKGAHALDFGCGPGLQGEVMAAAGLKVSGIDATPEFVKTAKSRGLNARVGLFDDLTEIEEYDGIWASFSLLHAPRSDLDRHLAAIKRALKPGGTFFIGMKAGKGEKRDDLGRFYTYYEETELLDALSRAGFGIDEIFHEDGKGMTGATEKFLLIHAHG